jgi:hypothetical protein
VYHKWLDEKFIQTFYSEHVTGREKVGDLAGVKRILLKWVLM